MFSNVGIIGLVVGYTIAGAFVFRAIEGGDMQHGSSIAELRNKTALKLWDLSCCGLNVFSEVRIRTFYFLIVSCLACAGFQENVRFNLQCNKTVISNCSWIFMKAGFDVLFIRLR